MSDNETKYSIRLASNDYSKVPTQIYDPKNALGDWKTDITRDKNGIFTGKITLVSKKKEMSWRKMKIRVVFINSQNKFHTVSSNAQYDDGLNAFIFFVAIQYYSTFAVNIEIDASLTMMPTFLKSVSSKDHAKKMFRSGMLADVTVKSKNGNEIPAHNYILSRSDVFDAMLNNHDTKEAQTKIIEISDIDYDVLLEMIRYLYYDEVPKIKEMAIDLLIASDKYNVQGLYQECVLFLWKNISMENYAQILMTADRLKIKSLKDQVIEYIISNRKEVFASVTWKKLKNDNMQLVTEVIEKLSLEFSKFSYISSF